MRKARNKTAKKRKPARATAISKTRAKSQAKVRPARAQAVTTQGDALDATIAAAATTLGICVDPAWQPAIKMNLQVILGNAALIDQFALPDDAEPAPIYGA
jgi:hypothetical protein